MREDINRQDIFIEELKPRVNPDGSENVLTPNASKFICKCMFNGKYLEKSFLKSKRLVFKYFFVIEHY